MGIISGEEIFLTLLLSHSKETRVLIIKKQNVMKKIVLSLAAIMMVSMSSVSMASNKGGNHHKGNHTEVIVRYENDRDHDNGYHRGRNHRNENYYICNDNRRYDNYRDCRDERYYEMRDRDDRCREGRYEYRHHHRHNNDAKVAGAILGTAALVLLATH